MGPANLIRQDQYRDNQGHEDLDRLTQLYDVFPIEAVGYHATRETQRQRRDPETHLYHAQDKRRAREVVDQVPDGHHLHRHPGRQGDHPDPQKSEVTVGQRGESSQPAASLDRRSTNGRSRRRWLNGSHCDNVIGCGLVFVHGLRQCCLDEGQRINVTLRQTTRQQKSPPSGKNVTIQDIGLANSYGQWLPSPLTETPSDRLR